MTGRTFRQQVIRTIVLVLFLSLLALGASCYVDEKQKQISDALRTVPAVLIPIGAGWLAFCVQRRVAFTKALFDVWQKIVVAVQDALQYTHLGQPSQADFGKVMHSLSCRIDDVRGAFINVGEGHAPLSDQAKAFVFSVKRATSLQECQSALSTLPRRTDIGVYSFETLKQIHKVISLLGFGQTVTPQSQKIARDTILALWGILRGELLKELDRDVPEYPDTPYRN